MPKSNQTMLELAGIFQSSHLSSWHTFFRFKQQFLSILCFLCFHSFSFLSVSFLPSFLLLSSLPSISLVSFAPKTVQTRPSPHGCPASGPAAAAPRPPRPHRSGVLGWGGWSNTGGCTRGRLARGFSLHEVGCHATQNLLAGWWEWMPMVTETAGRVSKIIRHSADSPLPQLFIHRCWVYPCLSDYPITSNSGSFSAFLLTGTRIEP